MPDARLIPGNEHRRADRRRCLIDQPLPRQPAPSKTTGIEQINIAVTQMDEVTQQNAALVEQASAAAQAMAEQAESLRTTVEVFKLGRG